MRMKLKMSKDLLQITDITFQKVHDARRKYEAGEYGKQTSDALKRKKEKQTYRKFFLFLSFNYTYIEFVILKWVKSSIKSSYDLFNVY